MTRLAEDRAYAAALVRRHLAGTVTRDAFVEIFDDSDDPLIAEAVWVVEHAPRGVWRRTETEWRNELAEIAAELERGDEGWLARPPAARPNAKLTSIAGWALFAVWSATGVVQNGRILAAHVSGEHLLSHAEVAFVWGSCLFGLLATGILLRHVVRLIRFRLRGR